MSNFNNKICDLIYRPKEYATWSSLIVFLNVNKKTLSRDQVEILEHGIEAYRLSHNTKNPKDIISKSQVNVNY